MGASGTLGSSHQDPGHGQAVGRNAFGTQSSFGCLLVIPLPISDGKQENDSIENAPPHIFYLKGRLSKDLPCDYLSIMMRSN